MTIETAYGYKKLQIFDILEKILQTSQFEIQDSDIVWKALRCYRDSKIDFSDALLGCVNKSAGHDVTITFDKHAAKLNEFELLKV